MSNLISVPRDLAVDLLDGLRITQERARKELRALLAKPAEQSQSQSQSQGKLVAWYKPHWNGKSAEWRLGAELTDAVFPEMWEPLYTRPVEQHQGEPVLYVERWELDRIAKGGASWATAWATDGKENPSRPGDCVALYTRPAEQPEPISSTSDKYKAELYDEVWQLARDMDFGNVTDALMKLKKQTAPVAEQERRQMIIERYPNVDPLQYEAAVNGLAAAPVAVVLPEPFCRQKLAAEGKPYPRSNCAVCGPFSPKWRECDAMIEAARLNPPQQ